MRLHPKITQRIAVGVLGAGLVLTLVVLAAIIIFLLDKGLPVLSFAFLFTLPRESGAAGGILPTLVGSILLPLLSLAVAVPLGVGTAVYLSEYTRESRVTRVLRFGTDCLAGIPSIIFGLFGLIFFVIILGMGWSLLAGGLTVAIMILPTIIRTSEEAIRAVPQSYREVSVSLGATGWETVYKVVLPNALPGILTGVMLSIGRAIGETAAVYLTAGMSLRMPQSVMDPVRTMSVHFYTLAREGISTENAYGTAAFLVLSILAINMAAYGLMHRFMRKLQR